MQTFSENIFYLIFTTLLHHSLKPLLTQLAPVIPRGFPGTITPHPVRVTPWAPGPRNHNAIGNELTGRFLNQHQRL